VNRGRYVSRDKVSGSGDWISISLKLLGHLKLSSLS